LSTFIYFRGKNYSFKEFIKAFEKSHDFAFQVRNVISNWENGNNEFLLETSGSTGVSKKLSFSRTQLEISAKLTINYFGFEKDNHFLCCLPVNKVAGFMMLIRALIAQANIVLAEPSNNPLQNENDNLLVDFSAFVPHQLLNVIDYTPEKLNILSRSKAVIIGGIGVNSFIQNKIEKLPFPVYETYGMTETLTHIAVRRLNSELKTDFFKTLPGIKIKQDNDSCLMIKSPVNNNLWLKTNDIVHIKDDETFQILGRKDNVINSGGVKLIPEKMELKCQAVMAKYFGDSAFFFGSIDDSKYGQRPILMIETDKTKESVTTQFMIEMNETLESYSKPSKILLVKSFVRTATLKINRKATILECFQKGILIENK